tara:strand:+ start:934 stop:2199 length:1266 start_codon:yes stop_codon:yes gene_type:complete
MEFAIRTCGRTDTIENHTIALIKDLGIPITIFCPKNEMYIFRKKFKHLNIKIKLGSNIGINDVNKKIQNHYNIGTKVVIFDDDVIEFKELKDDKLVSGDLLSYCERGFDLCKENNFKLFGFYPVEKAYFMKGSDITKGLSFVMGGIFGVINDRTITTELIAEDYERCVKNYEKYGGLIRFNKACFKNLIRTNTGGNTQTTANYDKQKEKAEEILKLYPSYFRLKKCKSKYPEVQLIPHKYCLKYHLLSNFRIMCWANNTERPNVSGYVENEKKKGKPCFSYTVGYIKMRGSKADNLDLTCKSKNIKFIYDLMKKYIHSIDPDFRYTAITLNKNIVCEPHTDKFNKSPSLIVALGEYTGGNLFIKKDEVVVKHNIKDKPLIFNGKDLHWNDKCEGERFSMVFYCACSPPSVDKYWVKMEDHN